jgi:hypothetical protein
MPRCVDENGPSSMLGRCQHKSALQLGPRKRAYVDNFTTVAFDIVDMKFSSNMDVLVHHGRHFGRTVHALCRVHTLLTNGILRNIEEADEPVESFTKE